MPHQLTPIFNEVTIYTLPYLKYIRLVSVCSSFLCINEGVRIELFFKKKTSI